MKRTLIDICMCITLIAGLVALAFILTAIVLKIIIIVISYTDGVLEPIGESPLTVYYRISCIGAFVSLPIYMVLDLLYQKLEKDISKEEDDEDDFDESKVPLTFEEYDRMCDNGEMENPDKSE